MPCPEVLILTPSDPENPSFISLLDRCIERGFYFEFDSRHQLPLALPSNLDGYKLIVLDPSLQWIESEPFKTRLSTFAARGGVVAEFVPIESFRRDLENPFDNFWDLVSERAALTSHNPRLRSVLSRRDDRQLLESLVGTALEPSHHRPTLDLPFESRFCSLGDVGSYWSRRPLLLAAEYLGDQDLVDRIRQLVDVTMATKVNPPTSLDAISDARTWLTMHRRTRDERYREYMKTRIDTVLERFPRLDGVICHRADRNGRLWSDTESWAMLAPSLVALGISLGNDAYIAEAVRQLRAAHGRHYDATTGWWHHGTRDDAVTAAKWGRGQGWALFGIAGTLEQLPDSHPDREWLCARLSECAVSARRDQDEATGCWHNIVDDPHSGIECSVTAMFVEVFSQAWKEGWCSLELIPPMVKKAWAGIKAHTFRNRTVSWCPGTGQSTRYRYYLNRPRVSQPSWIISANVRYLEAFGAVPHAPSE